MPFKEIATALLERGFSIIPLMPRAKDPLPGWGATKTVRDISKVEFLCAANHVPADANVGIVADENFLILESDDEAQLRQLVRNCTGREMPITLTSQARFGRPHFFYRQTPRSLEVGNVVVAGLFELRAKNQYVVGPGSTHPSGAIYQITADYEVLPMPGWLVDCLLYLKGESKVGPAGQRAGLSEDGTVGEGQRHYFLISQAGKLWDGNKTFDQLFAEVSALNEKDCTPPKTQGHVAELVRWVMQNGTPHDPGPTVVVGSDGERTGNELCERTLNERKTLLAQGSAPVLYESSLNQVFAYRGLGKTNFALGLAGCMANAPEAGFLKFKAPSPTTVLYVDGELPLTQLRDRVASNVGPSPNFWYLNAENLDGHRIPTLAKAEGQNKIFRIIERRQIKVVVFDSLASLFRIDTNDETAWIELEDFFLALRQQCKVCVITLHHAGKAGLQRGHSRGDDLLDVSIKLEKFPDWEPGQDLAFQLRYEKVRHGGNLEPFDAKLVNSKWEVDPTTDSIRDAMKLIEQGKGRQAIMKETGLAEWKVRKLLTQAQANNLVILNDKANKSRRQHANSD